MSADVAVPLVMFAVLAGGTGYAMWVYHRATGRWFPPRPVERCEICRATGPTFSWSHPIEGGILMCRACAQANIARRCAAEACRDAEEQAP